MTILELDRKLRLDCGLAIGSACLSSSDRQDTPRRSFLSIRCALIYAKLAVHSPVGRPRKGVEGFSRVVDVGQQFAGEMLGKRGEKPPLPCNCKRPFYDCTKPLPENGWEGAVAQK
jgi:hypothetical protein